MYCPKCYGIAIAHLDTKDSGNNVKKIYKCGGCGSIFYTEYVLEPMYSEIINDKGIVDFLYEDTETGEQYFVECATREEAVEILKRHGLYDTAEFVDVYTVEDAEILGYDTY